MITHLMMSKTSHAILLYIEQGRLLKILNLFNLIVTNMGTLKVLPISQAISSWTASLLNRKKANKDLLTMLFGSWENKLQLCIMQIRLSPPLPHFLCIHYPIVPPPKKIHKTRTTLQAATTLATMATKILILTTWFRK